MSSKYLLNVNTVTSFNYALRATCKRWGVGGDSGILVLFQLSAAVGGCAVSRERKAR